MDTDDMSPASKWMVETMHAWIKSTGNQRLGQFLWNSLHGANLTLALQIKGTSNDPFYFEENVSSFLTYVLENWED